MERTWEVRFCGRLLGYVFAIDRREARREARSLFPEYDRLKIDQVA